MMMITCHIQLVFFFRSPIWHLLCRLLSLLQLVYNWNEGLIFQTLFQSIYLSSYISKDASKERQSALKIMPQIFSNCVGCNFSFHGERGKNGFKDLLLWQALQGKHISL